MPHDVKTIEGIKVQKRSGQIVAFNFERITRAIGKAFKEFDGLPREADLPESSSANIDKVARCVFSVLKERALAKEFLTVEEIQDEVIRQLYENGFKEVGESYAEYRRKHTAQRSLFELYTTTKRDGKVVSFKPEKITLAIAKAFRAMHSGNLDNAMLAEAKKLSDKVVVEIRRLWPQGKSIHIEEIQDLVEKTLMTSGYYDVTRRYILYREERAKARRAKTFVQDIPLE